MADEDSRAGCQRAAQRSRRSRQQARRPHRVHISLTAGEFAALEAAAQRAGLEAAAQRAGLARGAYAAQVVVAAAEGTGTGPDAPAREALRELIRASGLVRRIGTNLNQAVAKLNATGQRSGDLLPYAAESTRRAARLDAAAEQVRKTLR